MTVESLLVRTLDIRFIDARILCSEAKVNLGITGYPTKAEEKKIHLEAFRIFDTSPEESKNAMRQLSMTLDEAIKIGSSSECGDSCQSLGGFSDSESIGGDSTGASSWAPGGTPKIKTFRRKGMLRRLAGRNKD